MSSLSSGKRMVTDFKCAFAHLYCYVQLYFWVVLSEFCVQYSVVAIYAYSVTYSFDRSRMEGRLGF